MPDSTPCVMCKAPRATKRCGKCRAVWYCSAHCQREHWTVHKVVCGWGDADKAAPAAADSGSNGDDDPNSLANFMKKRNAEKAQQAKELERLREEATDIVAALVGQPRDPALHLSLATKYLQLYRRDEAVEALGKAVDLLMSAASPAAAAESDVLRLGPSLLGPRLWGAAGSISEGGGRRASAGGARRQPAAAAAAAVSGSSGGRRRGARSRRTWRARGTPTPSTNCAARRVMGPARDHQALGPTRPHGARARGGGGRRRAPTCADGVAAAQARGGRSGSVEPRMLLARILYARILLRAAPSAPIRGRAIAVVPGALPNDPWEEALTVAADDADALEANGIASAVRAELSARSLGDIVRRPNVYADLAALLQSKLSRAGLAVPLQ